MRALNPGNNKTDVRLSELVTGLPIGIYRRTPGPDGKFIWANPAAAELLGFKTVEELTRKDFTDLFLEASDRKQLCTAIAKKGRVENTLLRLKKKDGAPLWGRVTAHAKHNDNGGIEFIDGIVEDYTRQKIAGEALRRSEKMRSLGSLAAGMAHEINNPLAIIMQNAAVLQIRLGRDNPSNRKAAEEAGICLETIQAYVAGRGVENVLARIQEASTRAAGIVQNMVRLVNENSTEIVPRNLAVLLDRSIAMAEADYTLKKKYHFKQIKILREYAPDLPSVNCNANDIQQVFLSILANGARAMTENAEAVRPQFIIRTIRDGDVVRVEMEDNGPGLDPATCRRVFDPLFTTKPTGENAGLGLAVADFIITENHKGEIGVLSTPGRGATFFIKLPTHAG